MCNVFLMTDAVLLRKKYELYTGMLRKDWEQEVGFVGEDCDKPNYSSAYRRKFLGEL